VCVCVYVCVCGTCVCVDARNFCYSVTRSVCSFAGSFFGVRLSSVFSCNCCLSPSHRTKLTKKNLRNAKNNQFYSSRRFITKTRSAILTTPTVSHSFSLNAADLAILGVTTTTTVEDEC